MADNGPAQLRDREAAAKNGARVSMRLRLLTCANMIGRISRTRLRAAVDTNLARYDVPTALDAADAALTMGALSARLLVTSGNVAGAGQRDGAGRAGGAAAASGDQRSTLIAMTAAGRARFARMAPVDAHRIEQAMAQRGRDETAQLWLALGHLKTAAALGRSNRRHDPRGTDTGANPWQAFPKSIVVR